MRILLVEDERKVASFIARALKENTYAVDVAETGEKALEMGTDVHYDAILLDVRLPRMSGIEVCRELRQRGVESPVLILTARGLTEQKVEGLDAGADDYLTKPFVLAELLARVRALVRRGFHSGNAKLSYADLSLDRHRRRAMRGHEVIPLTTKEFALLELFLLRAPELVTRSEIVEHVWDCHFDSETNLVEVYINRLRKKLEPDQSVKLLHTVRGVGYRLGMPE
ncbi:MAG: two-component system, OmpR family, copper resistance phosphate regulon response regulator CusR [Acidobacteriaceae bacterium]|jgi:DNA-binding response OmpR family regulator|nr:two-component system, OmpR family, copper resistance phosphate regulon response regulator CusR [Acidobacteriaceae bacterium]